ncbi:MAG: DUF697 domain-containing protein [Planctomycetaceae bacterium]|nr:DUF697 domain-containing protein [Planctomycetaceae bacterium]
MSTHRLSPALPGIPPSRATPRPIPPDAETGFALAAESTACADASETRTHRASEWGCPQPDRAPRPLSSDESDAFFDSPHRTTDGVEDEFPNSLDRLVAIPQKVEPAIRALLALGVGSVLLLLGVQLASFAVTLSTLPLAVQLAGTLAAGSLVLVVAYSLVTLVREYTRLRQTPRISLRALRQLEERAVMRQKAREHRREAIRQLQEFLDAYVTKESSEAQLRQFGISAQEWNELIAQAARLRSGPHGDDQAWMEEVDSRFLSLLDGVASRVIRAAALSTGFRTASTPTGFLDAALMTAGSVALVRNLCRLYQLKTDRWGTCLVLVHIVGNLVVSSQTEEVVQESSEQLRASLEGMLGTAAGSVVRFLGSRVAEGTSNAFLLMRLGSVTVRALRPIARERRN